MLTEVSKQILEGFAISVVEGIKDNIRNKRVTQYGAMNASGRSAESVNYRIDDDGLTIYSTEKYFTVLETGRKPGKRPPMGVIEEWINEKPVAPDGISVKSLAFLIARKIGAEGSLLYRQGGKSGVISNYINTQYIQENLISVLGERFKDYIINEFIKKSVEL